MRIISIITIIVLFCSISLSLAAEKALQNKRFQRVDNSIVIDSQTGLMWASQDNGKDIDLYDAEKYCEDYEAGGYTDWRLPDIKELATLYTKGNKNKDGYFIADIIRVSDCCMWSSDESMGGASIFSYNTGREPFGYLHDTYQLRALPVRGTLKAGPHKQKL